MSLLENISTHSLYLQAPLLHMLYRPKHLQSPPLPLVCSAYNWCWMRWLQLVQLSECQWATSAEILKTILRHVKGFELLNNIHNCTGVTHTVVGVLSVCQLMTSHIVKVHRVWSDDPMLCTLTWSMKIPSCVLLIQIDSWPIGHESICINNTHDGIFMLQVNVHSMGSSDHTLCTFTMCDVMSWQTDRTPTTVCVTPVQLWILFKSSKPFTWRKIVFKISALVAHWHSDSCTSCSHLIQHQLYAEQTSGKGGDCKCFGLYSICRRGAWR